MGLGQRSPESPLLDRNNGDQHGRDPGPTDSALTSRRSPSPETPHIQSRRTSRTSFVDLTDPSPERIKRQLSDSSIDELTPQAAGVYLTAVRFESRALISKEIIDGTNLYVRVSNQPDVAPAVINLRLCGDIQALFPVLVSECDIQATSTTKITKISVTFPWNGERLRLRKGRPEDWALFCTALRRRWQEHEVSDGAICKVEMLVHVDGQERGMES
ncbi:hypothetical protein MMC16_000349 [Acarospora aff. strigata]|nr:hypothetical protein [Acarospora aff. strigata]